MAREIWVADSETDPFKEGRLEIAPFVWGAYNGEEYHEFTETEDFIEFFHDKDVIVYAHNGGKFDWFFVLEYLESFDDLTVINGRISKFKIGDAEFRDSYNILPVPLATFDKDEIDYSIMEADQRYKPENWKKITDYLYKDCLYLYRAVTRFIDQYGQHLTLASTALKVWEAMNETKAPETDAAFYDTFYPYYYGGRVQAFETGEINGEFFVVDINSAYPFAMKHLHPFGSEPDLLGELPESDDEISRAFITLTARSAGAFPYRTDEGLSFPADGQIREFNITGWEYLAARDTGALIEPTIIQVWEFPETISFDSYIDRFYTLKQEAEKGTDEYTHAKLFLNSLYGKFAADPREYEEFKVVEPRFIQAATRDNFEFAGEVGEWALVSKPLPEFKQRFFNVAVGASITGFVRAYLWRAISRCQDVFYCDTDSIICRDFADLEISDELGAWDCEAKCDYGAIAGKKLYAVHDIDGKWKTASKGVRLNPQEIIRVAKGETIEHSPISPSFSLKTGRRFIKRKIRKTVVQ